MIITEKKDEINKGYLRKKCQIEAICGHGLRRKLFGKVFFSLLKKGSEGFCLVFFPLLSFETGKTKSYNAG